MYKCINSLHIAVLALWTLTPPPTMDMVVVIELLKENGGGGNFTPK
jgi:hypothetical protein